MDKIVQAFVDWCARKDAAALIEHTVVEGVLGVAVTAVGQVPAPYATWVVPLTMAVLTPVIAAIGNGGNPTTAAAATPVVATATETAPATVSAAAVAETAPTSTETVAGTTETPAVSTETVPAATGTDGVTTDTKEA